MKKKGEGLILKFISKHLPMIVYKILLGPQLQLLIFVVWVYLLFSNQVLPAWVEVVRAAARGGTLSGITLLCAV